MGSPPLSFVRRTVILRLQFAQIAKFAGQLNTDLKGWFTGGPVAQCGPHLADCETLHCPNVIAIFLWAEPAGKLNAPVSCSVPRRSLWIACSSHLSFEWSFQFKNRLITDSSLRACVIRASAHTSHLVVAEDLARAGADISRLFATVPVWSSYCFYTGAAWRLL